MNDASYNDIAEWYDGFLSERPVYRGVVLPHVLKLVEDVRGQSICDLACGQGWIARELARRGAGVTGIDLAENLLTLARRYEEQESLGIVYVHGDAQSADALMDSSFDGCVCVLALINIPDLQAIFRTVRRILKPGGWLVFVITHPCFETPHAQWVTTDAGKISRTASGYFDERIWMSSNPNGIRSRVGDYHRMLSTYLNTLVEAHLTFERMAEPRATGEQVELVPGNVEVPTIMLVKARAV
jgi:ubiquinone/menaquinone biosynthesis C-methylase UbiE